jgi:RNAse (barnase) inhibitor barstar
VSAWWDNGHLLTARIAFDVLNEESPSTVNAVNKILAPLREVDPSWTTSETPEHGFVECATWADEIKSKGGNWQSSWHFVD